MCLPRLCINRIRLEFKGRPGRQAMNCRIQVLIESDWNLKKVSLICLLAKSLVLIESDWNLKSLQKVHTGERYTVLIESDWNLKLALFDTFPIALDVLIESDWNLKVQEEPKEQQEPEQY